MIFEIHRSSRRGYGPLGEVVGEINLPLPYVIGPTPEDTPQDVRLDWVGSNDAGNRVREAIEQFLAEVGINGKHPGADRFGGLLGGGVWLNETLALVTYRLSIYRRASPERTIGGNLRSYRIVPPLTAIFDLRHLKDVGDIGQAEDPWILAVPGVYEKYGYMFQGPNDLVPADAAVLLSYPEVAVAIDEYLTQ